MGMPRQDIGDTENQQRHQYSVSTDMLLAQLKLHHDYAVPFQFVTKKQAVQIIEANEDTTPIEVCILPVPNARLTVDAIKHIVCRHFGISHNDMMSDRRCRTVQRPRMVAMYLAREFTSHSLVALGRFFHRDHTSLLNSMSRAEQFIREQQPIAHDIAYLREVLSA